MKVLNPKNAMYMAQAKQLSDVTKMIATVGSKFNERFEAGEPFVPTMEVVRELSEMAISIVVVQSAFLVIAGVNTKEDARAKLMPMFNEDDDAVDTIMEAVEEIVDRHARDPMVTSLDPRMN